MRIADEESLAYFEQAFNIAAGAPGAAAVIDFEDGRYLVLTAMEDNRG